MKFWPFRKPAVKDEFDIELERRIDALRSYLNLRGTPGGRSDLTYWEMVLKLELYREVQQMYRKRFRDLQ